MKLSFSEYQNQVLSKADGSNIHRVNGHLGIVLNALTLCKSFRKDSNAHKYEHFKSMADKNLYELFLLTKVKIPTELKL